MSSQDKRETRSVPPAEPKSEIGSLLANRYEVIRELGKGGMGVVYLCRDLATSERVALKRLRIPEDKSAQRQEETFWFHQEARAVASLEHPAIVRARDFGQLADGSPYLVMDVLPGRSVHEWMYTTKMPFSLVWALVDQTLAGLAHAHARGVIHGDLKPSNVMLDMASGTSKGPRAYILDLGLAWLRAPRHDPRLDGGPAPEASMHSGAGTVGWVAPEQIRRAATLVGPATDLYALGCIIYRVLVGKEVFEGNAQEVLRAHKRTPVPPLELPPDVPAGVSGFVQKLLAKKPWQRFEYAADARRAWAAFRPAHTATMEDVMASAPAVRAAPASSRPALGSAVAAAQSLTPGLLSLRPSPMIARDDERANLWQIVLAVCGAPPRSPYARRMVAVIGEAGVGKSRLAEWLCEQAHEQGMMVPLRARYGRIATALDGITGAVNQYFGLEGADRALVEQTLMQRWEVDPKDDAALSWVAATAEWLRPSPVGTNVPLGPTGKRFVLDTPELRVAVTQRVLERIAHDRPLLIWFDDLHLSSPNTFDVLARLRRAPGTLKMLAIATARSETLATDLDAALRLEATRADWGGEVLDLLPLAPEETQALLRATLPLASEAVKKGVEQSHGNPLFALQLLHAWAGGGYLKLNGNRYDVPVSALEGRAITTAELWDERLRAVPTDLRLAAYAAAALGEDIRGEVLKSLISELGMDAREALVALTRAQILLAAGNDRYRWPHALLLEHLLLRLTERNDAPAIYRLAAASLAKHPASGSRRIMKHRVTNLLRAGDDEPAAQLMFRFIEGSWRRGRDTAATLRDLELLEGHVHGAAAAEYALWRAEALRHAGKLDAAQENAETAQGAFRTAGDRGHEASAMRLLGHVLSDRGQPAQGHALVENARRLFEAIGDEPGQAHCLVVLGEIEYLLGRHEDARRILMDASSRCSELDDPLGRAQCLILLAMINTAIGAYRRARERALEARAELDGIGYRLGMAQCDVVLAHADHRAFEFERARTTALAARASLRDLRNPRGEAAAERLLAMIAIDIGDLDGATVHAVAARAIYENLADPWGIVEAKLLFAQIALARGDGSARTLVDEASSYELDEAEPRQHRHLTAAWLAHSEERWDDALRELEAARTAFGDTRRTADHTPHLLARFARMGWLEPVAKCIDSWLATIERQSADGTMALSAMTTLPTTDELEKAKA
ncbi:MAG TPA: protein kinase [Polyangiaceae bacterium]|jgi:tRNA A-37 threonylcarbamoyl transferase component Bud32